MKTLGVLLLVTLIPVAATTPSRPDQVAFREVFRELVETNTTLSAGSCTEAPKKMARRLQAAGLPDKDIHLLTVPDHPTAVRCGVT